MRASWIVRSAALPALVLALLTPTASPMTHMMDSPIPPAGPQLWKNVFLCGTELEQLEQVYGVQWDFTHLDEALSTGELSLESASCPDEKVYLFGCTEPQMIMFSEDHTEVLPIPVIVAVRTEEALPEKLGLNSVQMCAEQVVDMSTYKMGWSLLPVPRPPGKRLTGATLRKDRERVKALACSQRKARGALKNVKEERTRMFDYCMPYVFLPHKQREDDIPDTCVDVMCELPGRQAPLVFDYDWDMDTVDEFVDEKAEDEALEDEQKPVLATAIKEAVSTAKAARKREKEARLKQIEDLGETVRQRLERVRVLKFYPQNPLLSPDSRSKYVNRYYGHADQVH
mmetsp:Transcript_19228/g.43276  ORF Transcript_19228/g.43276 Transcript_19228/m.43276 type:complete len:342 (+) Transcript_19228:178-1203(+)